MKILRVWTMPRALDRSGIPAAPPAGPARAVVARVGIPGAAFAAFVFTQGAAASPWIINHNRGRKVAVQLLTIGGVEMDALVTQVTDNQVRVDFVTPTAGQAIVL